MTSLNISLPEVLKAYVEGQVASGDWGTPSEYIRELIRRDKERRIANCQSPGSPSRGQQAITSGYARDSGTTRLRNAPRLFTIGSETKQVEWFVSGLDEPAHPIGNYGALSSSFQSDGNIRCTRGANDHIAGRLSC